MQWLWRTLKAHLGEFWKGFWAGYAVWGWFLFTKPHFLDNLIVEYILKAIGAGALAFVSGLGTSLAADFYKETKPSIVGLAKKISGFFKKIRSRRNKKRNDKLKRELEENRKKECA